MLHLFISSCSFVRNALVVKTPQGMALVAAVKSQLRHWKPLLCKLNVEAGDDVEMIKVVESYALR